MKFLNRFTVLAILSTGIAPLAAATATLEAPKEATKQQNVDPAFSQAGLHASAAASLAWLGLVDRGDYGKSWDVASALMKLTVPKDEWMTIMTKVRKPLGSARSREVLDQRTAKDPAGLPKGDYMVMFYKTQFSTKTANELVTLYLEDGTWTVLTYQVN